MKGAFLKTSKVSHVIQGELVFKVNLSKLISQYACLQNIILTKITKAGVDYAHPLLMCITSIISPFNSLSYIV